MKIKDKPTKLRPLTLKQKEFIKEYLKTKNLTESARRVYDVKNMNIAAVIGSTNLRKVNIQQQIALALKLEGLDIPEIIKVHKETIFSGLGNKATNSDSLRGLDMLYRITGAYKHPIVEESYKAKLQKLNNKELKLEVEKLQKKTKALLDDI